MQRKQRPNNTQINYGNYTGERLLDGNCTPRYASAPYARRRRSGKMEPTQVRSVPDMQSRTGRQVGIHVQLRQRIRKWHHDVLGLRRETETKANVQRLLGGGGRQGRTGGDMGQKKQKEQGSKMQRMPPLNSGSEVKRQVSGSMYVCMN